MSDMRRRWVSAAPRLGVLALVTASLVPSVALAQPAAPAAAPAPAAPPPPAPAPAPPPPPSIPVRLVPAAPETPPFVPPAPPIDADKYGLGGAPVSSHGSGVPIAPEPPPKAAEPFAFGDFTWLNGANRQTKAILDTPYFTPEFLVDVNFTESAAHPIDNTVVGSTALSRNDEFTLAFLGFGGDFHAGNARGRLMTQFGLRSTLVPRNDGSANRGQFDLETALRYISEAYGGYHWDVLNGVNVDVGIFMSYIGLFSYDNFENWMYLPSFTSDNTPWFFSGIRTQIFTSEHLKIEPWIINGWQSYGKFNELPGFGGQILWRPTENVELLSNDYVGWDTQDTPGRTRFHSDNSFELQYFHDPKGKVITRAAFSITGDIGGEAGAGVEPFGGQHTNNAANCTTKNPCEQDFLSWMAYNRLWFLGGELAWTMGGGMMHNPGRYLVLAPTGNASPPGYPEPLGVAAASDPFLIQPGTVFDAFDYETGIQFMPNE